MTGQLYPRTPRRPTALEPMVSCGLDIGARYSAVILVVRRARGSWGRDHRRVGRGGMGVVYRARQVRLDRPCALKMILAGAHASDQSAARFLSEAQAIARLHHPHIVQIYSIGEANGLQYLELEYLPGGSLDQQLDGTPWKPERAARMLEQVARGVAHAHAHAIVHRDLKPANVLPSADGAPKISDFGLAKVLGSDSGLTNSEAIMGTPCYMAPEQAEGKTKVVGAAADVYALGAILYELLTGRPPFRGATMLETLEQVKSAEAAPPVAAGPAAQARHRDDLPALPSKGAGQAVRKRPRACRRPAALRGRRADRGAADRRSGAGLAVVPAQSDCRGASGRCRAGALARHGGLNVFRRTQESRKGNQRSSFVSG